MKKATTGGSYIRHPKTGTLKLRDVTKEPDPAAQQPVPAKPTASDEGDK
jgi:hypothetical protein